MQQVHIKLCPKKTKTEVFNNSCHELGVINYGKMLRSSKERTLSLCFTQVI